ncbi:MAG: YbaB/EbfC family nucleoid-associated protein [Clostridiales bacterium]|jgi:DNA-binding YbaB/EbfC family protein|nr:YbaB/EbfC family nucleoid-associated protein [Clostridiales bacterium]
MGGFFGKIKDMGGMIKQAQEMQNKITEIKSELEEKEYVGTSGAGAVVVVATGKMKITKIEISPETIKNNDKETLEDLIMIAINNALVKSSEDIATKIGAVTGGLNIPGLM